MSNVWMPHRWSSSRISLFISEIRLYMRSFNVVYVRYVRTEILYYTVGTYFSSTRRCTSNKLIRCVPFTFQAFALYFCFSSLRLDRRLLFHSFACELNAKWRDLLALLWGICKLQKLYLCMCSLSLRQYMYTAAYASTSFRTLFDQFKWMPGRFCIQKLIYIAQNVLNLRVCWMEKMMLLFPVHFFHLPLPLFFVLFINGFGMSISQ